ncbi:MAG: prepilin-type N-terminal cleavage/methylation domain-containing protein [Actinobacteria bacterium]|nr:prepilin-type N-terminal cleavage/methylation domain-containing protein [Actinomycetota bacterium]
MTFHRDHIYQEKGHLHRVSSRSAGRESGFTLVEMMVAMMIFAIVLAIVFSTLTQLFVDFANRNRDITVQQTADVTSASLGRYIRSATPEGLEADGTTLAVPQPASGNPPAVLLACPDAIIFFSDLAFPTAEQVATGYSGSGGWIYMYLEPDNLHQFAAGAEPNEEVYTFEADLVTAAWVSSIASNVSPTSSPTWSSSCGASSGTLTSSVIAPPSAGSGLVAPLLSVQGVVAASPGTACSAGDVGTPCSGPQVFTQTFTVSGQTTTNSGYGSTNPNQSSPSCTTNSNAPRKCTTNPANVAAVSFSLTMRHFTCTTCSSGALQTSPATVLQSSVVMQNVAIDYGFGSVSF